MSLNIKNERTVALVRQLAELTHQSQTSAIEEAVALRLAQLADAGQVSGAERARHARIERLVSQLQQIARAQPELTRDSLDDDLYDASGLPR